MELNNLRPAKGSTHKGKRIALEFDHLRDHACFCDQPEIYHLCDL